MPNMVDAHVHVFPPELIAARNRYLDKDAWFSALYSNPDSRMATAEDVLEHMDTNGLDVSVVFGFAFKDPGLCRLANDYVIEATGEAGSRLVGLACLSPETPGAAEELERCLDAGLHGCGELMPDGQGLSISALQRIAASLQDRGLPLMIHSNEPVGHHYPGKGAFTPRACQDLALAFPELTVVLAHVGGGLFLYELMPEVRKSLANVYYDTSAVPFLYDPAVYAVVVECAGEGKLLFGSDFPLLPATRYLTDLEHLPPGARQAILGGNARKVFRI